MMPYDVCIIVYDLNMRVVVQVGYARYHICVVRVCTLSLVGIWVFIGYTYVALLIAATTACLVCCCGACASYLLCRM